MIEKEKVLSDAPKVLNPALSVKRTAATTRFLRSGAVSGLFTMALSRCSASKKKNGQASS